VDTAPEAPDTALSAGNAPVGAPEAAARRAAERAFEAWLVQLEKAPHRFDFYQVLRRLDAHHLDRPRLGEAPRPQDEPLRVSQPPEMDFAPAPLHALRRKAGGVPRLQQRMFGLLGPNGPLPLHLTEFTRERALHHGDHAMQRFLDLFTHRLALLFYRAWAQAQPALSLDRPGDTHFIDRLGGLIGLGLPTLQARDALPDHHKLHFVGRLAGQVRDADGLLAWCRQEFDVPVDVTPWCGHWMPLDKIERTRLGRRAGSQLGRTAVLGESVWDVQHKFRITLGPLRLAQYRRFLPGGRDLPRLQALVRHWVGLEFAWDVRLVLAREDVPRLSLGRAGQPLGHSSWLGRYTRDDDAGDLCIDVERVRARTAGRRDLPERADFSTWPEAAAAT
jgi:type VI secretion system protein ImpH